MIISKKITLFREKYKASTLIWSNYLFILYAFLLPISNFWSEQIFITILILFFFYGDIKEKLLFALKNKVVQAFLLFYLIHFIWMIGSTHIDIALYKLSGYRFILYILIFISMIQENFKEKILSGFVMGIFFSELMSYSMQFNITIPLIQLNAYYENVPFMLAYTQYSIVLSIALGIVLYTLFTKKQHPILKILYILFFLSSSTNIFIIASKLGYGLYFFSIVTVFIYLAKKNIPKKLLLLIIIIPILGFTLAYNTSSLFQNRASTMYNSTIKAFTQSDYSTSTGTRIGFYKASFELMKDNLIFGVGTGDHSAEVKKITDHYNNFYSNAIASGNATGLESELLDTFVQFGLIGLLIYILIFYSILKNSTADGIFSMLKYLLVVIMFISGIPSYIFKVSDIGSIFLLLATLTLVTYHHRTKEQNAL